MQIAFPQRQQEDFRARRLDPRLHIRIEMLVAIEAKERGILGTAAIP